MARYCLPLVLLAITAVAHAEDAKFDFRKKRYDDQWFKYNGGGAGECIEPADDGLRIHFPDGKAREPVGIVWNCRVRGDFIVTARYAILKAEPTPLGSGIELYLMLANAAEDGIPVLRIARSDEGRIFNCMVRTYDEKKKRVSKGFQQATVGPESDCGQIRLERKGTDFFASLAEGESDEFKNVLKMENIDTADVKMVRFAALSRGAKKAQLDVRLLEFRLQGELVGLQGRPAEKDAVAKAAGAPAGQNEQTASKRPWLWLAVGLGGVLLVLFLGLAAVVVLLRMNRASDVSPTRKRGES